MNVRVDDLPGWQLARQLVHAHAQGRTASRVYSVRAHRRRAMLALAASYGADR